MVIRRGRIIAAVAVVVAAVLSGSAVMSVAATKQVLASGLGLLGIVAPERM